MDKTVFITGTSSGLGNLTARYFAENGWNVAATMRNPKKETGLSDYPNLKLIATDVTDINSIKEAMQEAITAFGKIDVVVNNAGIGMYGALELTSETDIDRQYAVNVRGPLNVIRAFLPHFRKNKKGAFINIGSVMGLSTALPLGSLYNMSKFALEGLIEGLYFELKPLNIRLHLVEPGGFASSFGTNTTFSTSKTISDYDKITLAVKNIMDSSQQHPEKLTDPIVIVKVIYDLATGKRKTFRNVVGKDAKMLLLLRKLLPINNFLNFLGKRLGI